MRRKSHTNAPARACACSFAMPHITYTPHITKQNTEMQIKYS
jgi:hypothetical protein